MKLLQIVLLGILIGGMGTASFAQEEEIYVTVEKMPAFPGCEVGETEKERKECTETELLKYVYQNITYPTFARENGIEGLVVITFVINEKGEVEGAKWLKDIGGGCADESVRVINTFNDLDKKWKPGMQKGKAVKVRYNLPIRFRLQQNETATKEDTTQYKTFDIDNEKDKAAGIYQFQEVEKYPIYPGCHTIEEDTARQMCTEIRMMNYIYSSMFYPMMARMNDVEGTVYVTFVVSEAGKIENIEILEDIGSGCGDEVIRIMDNMNSDLKWKPAKAEGKDVKVRMIIPVDFTLE